MSQRRWLEITVPASREDTQRLETRLIDAGALSVSLEDGGDEAILEPPVGTTPVWSRVNVTGLFAAGSDIRAIRRSVMERLAPFSGATWRVISERDWVRDWSEKRQARRFGRRLWVVPDTGTPLPPDAVGLILKPGLAFGTGAHATTALCLEWLDAHPPLDMDVLDYGCGSGILGIAAARLGARQVLCIDNDPQALEATRANAARNACTDVLRAAAAGTDPPAPVHLVLANILARPLLELAPYFARQLAGNGRIVLSGVLPEQCDALCAWYHQNGFKMDEIDERDGWARLCGIRGETVR